MSDKKKSELSVVPEFVDGEQPTAAKLNSIGSLLKREGFILEKSVGDIWGESEPYSDVSQNLLSSPIMKEGSIDNLDESQDGNGRSLDIVNLGRAIGPMSKLNPKILTQGLSDGRTAEIKEEIPAGVYEYKMKMPVDWSQPITFPPTDDAYEIRVSSLADLNSEGDYYVDEEKNTVYSYLVTGSSSYPYVTYKTTPSKWASGSSYAMSNFNTIPDISQIGYSDLSISQNAQGLYEFVFPEVTHTARGNGDTALVEEDDVLFGSVYTLPASIRAVCGGNYFVENSGIANTVIPEGMIYLKNAVTGEIYSDATYYYNSDSSVLVEGVELDLDDNYYFITVGTDLTSCIEDIYNKLGNHTHDGKYGEKSVSVKDLSDNYVTFDNDQKVYFPSTKEGNHFSQYLHRDGYISGDPHNDGNAMRGNLVIGRRASSAGSYLGSGDSYRLNFGTNTDNSQGFFIMKEEQPYWNELKIRSSKFSNNASFSELILDDEGSATLETSSYARIKTNLVTTLESGNYSQVYGPLIARDGISSSSSSSSLLVEGDDYNGEGQEWFHAKTSSMTYYIRNKKVYGSENAYLGNFIKSSSRASSDFLIKKIEFPAGMLFSSGAPNILGVDVIVSPGLSQGLSGIEEPGFIIGTNSWEGYSSGTVENGVSWKIFQSDNPGINSYINVVIPTGGHGAFPKDDLIEETDGSWYAWLDIAVTVRYRNVEPG